VIVVIVDSGSMHFGEVIAKQIQSRRGAAARQVHRNSSLYVCGEPGSTVFVILSGWIIREVPDRAGKRPIIDVHNRGEIVGELSLFDGMRHESAVAKSECVVQVVQHGELIDIIQSHELLPQWTSFLVQRLHRQQEMITQFVSLDSERRLAARLLMLSSRTAGPGESGVSVQRVTHEELAAMIGTTRSRVGGFLQRFDDMGVIHRAQGNIVVYPELLRNYLETTS
jgi:CRP-like cAMP-binding protein